MMDKLNRLVYSVSRLRWDERLAYEAVELIHNIREELVNMPELRGHNVKYMLQYIDRISQLISEASEKLTELEDAIQHKRYRTANKLVKEVVKQIAEIVTKKNVLYSGVNVAPATGLLSPIDTTNITNKCGGVASRIYGYIVRSGRVSSTRLSHWANEVGLVGEEVSKAIQCLLSRGYLITESEGGEIYYRAVFPE